MHCFLVLHSIIQEQKETENRIIQVNNGVGYCQARKFKKNGNICEIKVKITLLHGAETWGITKKYKKKVEVVGIDAIRMDRDTFQEKIALEVG